MHTIRALVVRRRAWVVFAGVLSMLGGRAAAGELHTFPDQGVAVTISDSFDSAGALHRTYAVSIDGVNWSEPIATSCQLELAAGTFDPLLSALPVAPELAAGGDVNVYLVQFIIQPLPAFQQAIAERGGRIGPYVANNALVVTMSPASRDAVAALPFVRYVGKYEPAYRLEASLRDALERGVDRALPRRIAIEVLARGAALQQEVADLIRGAGGEVHYVTPEGYRFEATVPLGLLPVLARLDAVNFIEPWGGPIGYDGEYMRTPSGSNANLIETTLGYTGQGVRGEVLDSGVRATHQAFQSPAPLMHTTNGTSTSHGTNTYGIVFGDGTGNFAGRGFLPDREQGIFGRAETLTQFGGLNSRYAHSAQLVDPNGPYHAAFQSCSVGSTWTTTYTSISAEMDDIVYLYDLLICQSQSNQGTTSSRPQAWAKNVVSVGGIRHYNNSSRADDRWSSGGSTGPAADGRIKPDLAHFYDSVTTTSDTNDTSYRTDFGGTSAATPITAGAFGLLFQMWHQGVWAGHGGAATVFDSRPKVATAKALMINTAYQYAVSAGESGFTDLTRVRQGWGMANLEALLAAAPQTFVVDETDVLLPLEVKRYFVRLAPATPEFKTTLVYTDPKGNPGVQSQHRVNNLSLRVTSPAATVYWGNNGLSAARWSTSGGTEDTKNTVENVFIQAPADGWWLVEVLGTEIVQDGRPETAGVIDADYALVINGGQVFRRGDVNCDGAVDFHDIDAFVAALAGPDAYLAAHPACNWSLADANDDQLVDFFDIDAFVALLGT